MKSGIYIKKGWFDDDLIRLEIKISDGASLFFTEVYAGHNTLAALVDDLDRFRGQVYGGIYDIQLGAFGPEYAKGAVRARLHFHQAGRGRLFITVNGQSEWNDFTVAKVASEATLFLTSEPALLDNFVEELKRLQTGKTDEAILQGV